MTNPHPYAPGLHILATFSAPAHLLQDVDNCRSFFDTTIVNKRLNKVGEAYHAFSQGGFTAIIALTESHLSIHTWPEHELATFDIFLSNFMRDNSSVVRSVYSEVLHYFQGAELNKVEVLR